MHVKKLTHDDGAWTGVDGHQIFVNDLVDAASDPEARMTVGYARLARGESMAISFPYDEVLVVTKGTYVVRTQDGQTLRAGAGEVIYLGAGTANDSWAEEDAEMVYVASPPDVYAAHVAASSAG